MRHSIRSGFVAIAVLAVALHGLVPAGWMPSGSVNGPLIVLCTGHGPLQLTLGADGKLHKHSPAHRRQDHQLCPFAG